MKKIFSLILILILPFCVLFVGCSKNSENNQSSAEAKWQEYHSISYNNGYHKSYIEWNYSEPLEITKDEYNEGIGYNSSNGGGSLVVGVNYFLNLTPLELPLTKTETISSNRKEFFENADNQINKTKYFVESKTENNQTIKKYYKTTIISYKVYNVKVRITDGIVEIAYGEKIIEKATITNYVLTEINNENNGEECEKIYVYDLLNNNDDDPAEVSSCIVWNYSEAVEVTKAQFDKVDSTGLNDQGKEAEVINYFSEREEYEEISGDRTLFLEQADKEINKEFYYSKSIYEDSQNIIKYYKTTKTLYKVYNVKVEQIKSNLLKITYYGEYEECVLTKTISINDYKISYIVK